MCDVWASQVDFCGAYIWFGPHQLNVFSRALALQCDLSQMKPGIKFGVRSCVQSPDETLQFMLQTMPLGLVTVVFTPSDPLKGVTVRCNLTASPSKHPMPGLCCLCFSVSSNSQCAMRMIARLHFAHQLMLLMVDFVRMLEIWREFLEDVSSVPGVEIRIQSALAI